MSTRNIACIAAAAFIGLGLTASATQAWSKPASDVVVKGKRVDPALQRTVSYADLNLAFRGDQQRLQGRIWKTADQLCFDLNGNDSLRGCTDDAMRSTKGQVSAAIDRAKRQMAGEPVGPAIAISMVIGGQ